MKLMTGLGMSTYKQMTPFPSGDTGPVTNTKRKSAN